jgi:HTH-type transcriptional regulator/antitoxin HigA
MEMSKTDMEKYLGSQSRVSEILNRKRSLTLKMIKTLYKELKIPAEVLLT